MQVGFCFVDCPGYGYAKAAEREKETWRRFMELYLRESAQLHRMNVLVDARRGVQQLDIELFRALEDRKLPYCITLTKADKLKSPADAERAMQKAYEDGAAGRIFCSPIVHLTSAHTGYGV